MEKLMKILKPEGAFLIAEAGVNHNGSLDTAKQLAAAAKEAGADAVKFQSFRADALASVAAPKAGYQIRTTGAGGSQLDMLRQLELSADAQRTLAAHCADIGIPFLSSPFDLESAHFLVADMGLATIKVPSGELVNGPLLHTVARAGASVILSTGMADLDEIRLALDVLAHGYLHGTEPSALDEARGCADDAGGRRLLADNVVLLQCTTEYPAPPETINLRAMATLAETFGLPVGLSDHSAGSAVAIAAAALGARVIEKHFTLDRAMPGPDHAASVEPDELARMVADIRTVEAALGTGVKQPFAQEVTNRPIVRQALCAVRAIAKGEIVTRDAVTMRRPGNGLSPMHYWDLVGRPAARDFAAGELLEQ